MFCTEASGRQRLSYTWPVSRVHGSSPNLSGHSGHQIPPATSQLQVNTKIRRYIYSHVVKATAGVPRPQADLTFSGVNKKKVNTLYQYNSRYSMKNCKICNQHNYHQIRCKQAIVHNSYNH